jgi:FkbH-like protein
MLKPINIAILSNFTSEYIAIEIKEECLIYDINAVIYNAPYSQYMQEALNKNSGLYTNNPDLIFIMLEGTILLHEWYDFNSIQNEDEKKKLLINSAYESLIFLFEKIHSNCDAMIIVNNLKVPYYTPMGILDNKKGLGLKRMITGLNQNLEDFAKLNDYLYVFDYNGLCSNFGISKAENRKMYYLNKNILASPFMKVLAAEYMRYVIPFKSLARKCLILDLDNTLWGGVAGEDGISGIKLDIEGIGRSFYDFQNEIINLYNKGIILAINSKNNFNDAFEIIEKHPYMLLRSDHFSSIKINWQDKAQNIKDISKELNIGIDSMVFFDDSPFERDYVKSILPELKVVEVPPDPSKYIDKLRAIPDFEILSLTSEDFKRNKLYEINKQRTEFRSLFSDLEDFLFGLETVITIENANKFNIPRIAQLTQKTNQFNMTNKRYHIQDIEEMFHSSEFLVLSCSVTDKFGETGVVGVCVIKMDNDTANIDTFLLSCRVLGRNIEYAFLEAVIEILRTKGFSKICSCFIKTEKNEFNKDFYLKAGFETDYKSDGESYFALSADKEVKSIDYINVLIL